MFQIGNKGAVNHTVKYSIFRSLTYWLFFLSLSITQICWKPSKVYKDYPYSEPISSAHQPTDCVLLISPSCLDAMKGYALCTLWVTPSDCFQSQGCNMLMLNKSGEVSDRSWPRRRGITQNEFSLRCLKSQLRAACLPFLWPPNVHCPQRRGLWPPGLISCTSSLRGQRAKGWRREQGREAVYNDCHKRVCLLK